ncbi:MAG: ferredoxin [Gemmatimonadota bacterium]|nr:ferredoxin [Gemmatimonadota bacterium]
MREAPERFDKNAPGDWYTTATNCMACGAPEAEAPELLARLEADNYDTYFLRQPETAEEVEQACRAAEVCCLSAIRYGGTDVRIIRRLGNRAEYCDYLLTGGPVRFAWETDAQWEATQPSTARWWRLWRR